MKPPLSLPVTLNRHQVYIFPTLYGFLFIGVLLAMLAGSINYDNNMGFLLVFLLGGIAFVSMIHTYRNLFALVILSASAEPVFAGDIANFKFMVRSKSVDRKAIGASFKGGDAVIENIGVGTDTSIDVKTAALNRGVFQPGRLTLWTRFPAGLFRAWCVLDLDLKCIVYPKPIAGPITHKMGTGNSEENNHSLVRGLDDFAGLKTYQPGDPIRRIAWKSLSRGLGVFSKDFEGDESTSMWFDYESMTAMDPENRLSRMCYMVLKAHNMNVEYGIKLPGKSIPPGKGDRHKNRCLKALALFGKSNEAQESRF